MAPPRKLMSSSDYAEMLSRYDMTVCFGLVTMPLQGLAR